MRVIGDGFSIFLGLVLRSLPPIDLKAIDFGHVFRFNSFWHELRIHDKQNVGEGAAEVGPIDIVTLLLGYVDFLATRTVDFDSGGPDLFAHADREGVLTFAEDSWANPEGALLVLISHYRQTFWGDYVSRMDEPIDVCGLLIDGQISA